MTPGAEIPEKQVLADAKRVIRDALAGGRTVDAREVEASAMALARISPNVPEQVELMLAAARYFYVTGNALRGIPIAQKARSLALEHAMPKQTIDALIAIGICSADSSGIAASLEAYADALGLAQSLGDTIREAKIWQNLGAALVYAGVHREALTCFRESLRLSEADPRMVALSAGTYTNVALSHLHLEEMPLGLGAIRRAIELAGEPKDAVAALNRVLAENCFARLLLEAGDFSGARDHAHVARRYAAVANTPRADISASVAEGLTEVFSGDIDTGLTRLTRTLERAQTLRVNARETLVALVKAYEFAGKPDRALVFLRQLLNHQRESQQQNALRHISHHMARLHDVGEDEVAAMRRLTAREEILEGRIAKQELSRQSERLFLARIEVMERLAVAAELRDDATGEHSYRVGRMASLLGKEFGCDEETVYMLDIAARLHDIGKIGIPDGILLKDGPLNPAERDVMKTHTTIGAEVLAKSEIPQMKLAEEIARDHHEWWDGTGYPGNKSGQGIPLAARITALADVFDALTHKRPYKVAWSIDSALAEILSLRGRQFDPQLTDLFLKLIGRLRREHEDLDDFLGQASRNSPLVQARKRIDSIRCRANPAEGSDDRFDVQR